MTTKNLKLVMIAASLTALSSCTTLNNTMKEPNTRVNLNKSDFSLSEQVVGEATSVKVLGIDWGRIFMKKTGTIEGGATAISLATIPVVGNMLTDKTANYALYEMMTANPGYDVVFYPQYETKVFKPVLGIGIITKITTVKTKARLGKLNK
jgi:hypothetical protein